MMMIMLGGMLTMRACKQQRTDKPSSFDSVIDCRASRNFLTIARPVFVLRSFSDCSPSFSHSKFSIVRRNVGAIGFVGFVFPPILDSPALKLTSVRHLQTPPLCCFAELFRNAIPTRCVRAPVQSEIAFWLRKAALGTNTGIQANNLTKSLECSQRNLRAMLLAVESGELKS